MGMIDMCNKRNSVTAIIDGRTIRIDPCMKNVILMLNILGVETLACCSGHGKYNMSIVISDGEKIFDMVSLKDIPRNRRFYKKDKNGYFYIPEAVGEI